MRLSNKCPDHADLQDPAARKLKLVTVNDRPVSLKGSVFKFLNHSSVYENKINWNDPDQAKLWLYNLHYADYLQQTDQDKETGLDLISQWIEGNPPCDGNGWEPYPLSLRIVNWIKFLQRFDIDDETKHSLNQSLYLQTRSLRQQLEFHLLGNHLFKNAVALLFSGYYFTDSEAKEWYAKGRGILIEQLKEQVLSDGGHFERAPMYHALILEDILDCLNLVRSTPEIEDTNLESLLKEKAVSMLSFLDDILHPDGSLPVFNDTAQSISSTADQLFSYARRLELQWKKTGHITGHITESRISEKPEFGLYVIKKNHWQFVIDAGVIGPDYLPGHAHCDTLSYELSLAGNLIVVNAGVFQYAGDERNIYRATRSHNTVEIDHTEQHEIWSTFRVARRGYPRNVSVIEQGNEIFFTGQQTGYQRLQGKPLQQRDVHVTEDCIKIVDRVIGKGDHTARSFIHLHPDVKIISKIDNQLQLKRADTNFKIDIPAGLDWIVEDYEYSPEFGLKIPAKVVVITGQGKEDFSFSYRFLKMSL